jgi:hypothetical protein
MLDSQRFEIMDRWIRRVCGSDLSAYVFFLVIHSLIMDGHDSLPQFSMEITNQAQGSTD